MTANAIVDIARFVSATVLFTAMLVLSRRAFCAFGKAPQRMDFIWLLFWGLSLNRLQWLGRSVFFNNAPNEPGEAAWLLCGYILSIVLWSGVLLAYRWYQDPRHDS